MLKLDPMIGHEYMVDGFNERVLQYSFNRNSVLVVTDRRKREFDEAQLSDWVKKCLPVQGDYEEMMDGESSETFSPPATNQPAVGTVVYQPSFTASNFSDLRAILMKNIERVQEDKAYLDQAVAVRDNVQSIIELTKNEIDYVKTLNRLNK